jgi:hypothetical protein
MRSLAYKNLIWKTTWYKKNGTTSKPESKPTGPAAPPAKVSQQLERLHSEHWARSVKHGWSKV